MVSIRFEKRHKAALILGLIILLIDLLLFKGRAVFVPFLAVALTIAWLPHWLDIFRENRRQKELEARFPDFVRNLTGAIKSGMPASNAVIQVSATDYGALTPYIKKLANQLEWAIPFHNAFMNFGRDTNNQVVKRAIATVIQAEQAGGNIEDVLISVTNSLIEINKIKEERKTSIHGQIVQSYVIFFVFLVILAVIQTVLIPYMLQFGTTTVTGLGLETGFEAPLGPNIELQAKLDFSSIPAFISSFGKWLFSLNGIFLLMALIQGFFAGIILGKLAEGDMTAGLKHSLIMMTLAFVFVTFAQGVAVGVAA